MELREILTIDDPFEADLIEEALQGEEIPYQVIKHEDDPLEPGFKAQHGWGTVLVPEDQVDRAREVIDEAMKAKPVSPDDPTASEGSEPP